MLDLPLPAFFAQFEISTSSACLCMTALEPSLISPALAIWRARRGLRERVRRHVRLEAAWNVCNPSMPKSIPAKRPEKGHRPILRAKCKFRPRSGPVRDRHLPLWIQITSLHAGCGNAIHSIHHFSQSLMNARNYLHISSRDSSVAHTFALLADHAEPQSRAGKYSPFLAYNTCLLSSLPGPHHPLGPLGRPIQETNAV